MCRVLIVCYHVCVHEHRTTMVYVDRGWGGGGGGSGGVTGGRVLWVLKHRLLCLRL